MYKLSGKSYWWYCELQESVTCYSLSVWCSRAICDGGVRTKICIPMCSCVDWFISVLRHKKENWKCSSMCECVCPCASYLFKMRNVRLPPVKLKLLVNVVLQALTHAALLVRRIGFQAEQAVTLLETWSEGERREKRERETERWRGGEKEGWREKTAGN